MGGTRIGLKVVGLMMTFGFIAVCLFWFKGPFNPMVYLYAILGIVGLFPMMIERFNWRVALINKLFFILALTGLIALIIAHDFDSIAFLSSSFVLFYAAGVCYMMAITSDSRFAEMYMEHRDCYIVVKYRHNQTLPFVPGHLEWFLGLIIAPIKEAPVNSYRNAHTKFKTRTERVRFSCLSDAKSFASNMGSIVKNADSMEFISITFSNGLFWKNISKMKKTKSGSPSSKRPSFLTRVRSNANIHKASLIVCSIAYIAVVIWTTIRCFDAYSAVTADDMEKIFGTIIIVVGPAITGFVLCEHSTVGSMAIGITGILTHIVSLMNDEAVIVDISVPAMIGCILLILLAMIRSDRRNLLWWS